ncbi:MAG: hypothetical protein WA129_03170 [Acidovorax sp.]
MKNMAGAFAGMQAFARAPYTRAQAAKQSARPERHQKMFTISWQTGAWAKRSRE